MKYIFVRHWDYWYRVYHIGEYAKGVINGVEFHIVDQPDRESEFFHFDFYTLTALEIMIENDEFMDRDDSEYADFLEKYRALKCGEIDFFIGSLYYQTFQPDIGTCNDMLLEGKNIFDLKSPSYKPYYAVMFIGEERPLMPDLLVEWTIKVCTRLFRGKFEFRFLDLPSFEKTLEAYNSDERF